MRCCSSLHHQIRMVDTTDHALHAATRVWFTVAVAGQLMFAAYIALFYGGAAAHGRIDAWTRVLKHGYVRGDAAGNVAIVVHLLSALILIAGGAIQFVPQIREAAPRFHRWNGRFYVLTAFTTSVAGLYMTWVRGTFANTFQRAAITLNAILIVVCA